MTRTTSAADGVLVDGITKTFAPAAAALDGVDLSVNRGQFVAVIGPSGCGKSTLLRIVAGLEPVDRGTVSIFGQAVAAAAAAKRIGFVPQTPALLPWRTVLANVRLPVQVNRRVQRSYRDPIKVLESLGLGHVLDRRPAQLSVGMQQRVAIARALVLDPAVLLMDEPFAALDELTREQQRHRLLDVWQADRKTVLFVTHSVAEAVTLADAIVVMSGPPGRIHSVVPVDLPRPRGEQVETTAEFHAMQALVRRELRVAWGRHG